MKKICQIQFFLLFIVSFLLIPQISHSEQIAIVDRENGDRLTGRWLRATNTHFEIEYNGQVLRLPLKGHRVSFTTDIANVPDRIATDHYDKGQQLLQLELPELAKRKFEAALEEFPLYADAHYQLGLLHKKDGEIEKALVKFRSVLLIDNQKFDLVPILTEIGEAAATAEQYEQTLDAFQLILKHYPDHESTAAIAYRTGFLLIKDLNDPNAGFDVLYDAVQRFHQSPEHEEAVYLIGLAQAEKGEYQNALSTLKNFANNYPESEWLDDALLKRAVIYLQMGKPDEAINEAKRAGEKSNDSEIIEKVGEVIQATAWNIYTHNLPDTNIQVVVVDGNSLWIGTPKGIAQIVTDHTGKWRASEAVALLINEHLPTVPDVRSIAVDETSVWVGTRNQGILHYNRQNNQVRNYTLADGFPSNWIRDIELDDEEVWFATDAGVVRWELASGSQTHYRGNSSVADDIYSIALTPESVWAGTADANIAFFDRRSENWQQRSFVDIDRNTQIVRFEVINEKMLFSWYNADESENGFFLANWDGSNGESYPIITGFTEKELLSNIYVTGQAGKSAKRNNANEDDTKPLHLQVWAAMNDSVTIYDSRLSDFIGIIKYPEIVLSDAVVQCIAVDRNRAWIGTSKGMLTIEKEKLSQTVEE
ncbi:tetratricopeptide repeat protein [Candidatus Poribacteria bacterium]|nr:tetratricopeptide repeat protein [Candidatus Poribacteria bacterium]MYI93219.1 tetratricopeptide repeat protein [Candidatus Poribacteria bacterium]